MAPCVQTDRSARLQALLQDAKIRKERAAAVEGLPGHRGLGKLPFCGRGSKTMRHPGCYSKSPRYWTR